MNDSDLTVDKLIEFLKKISEDGKGNYKIINGEYNLALTFESFEIEDNKNQPCVIIW